MMKKSRQAISFVFILCLVGFMALKGCKLYTGLIDKITSHQQVSVKSLFIDISVSLFCFSIILLILINFDRIINFLEGNKENRKEA